LLFVFYYVIVLLVVGGVFFVWGQHSDCMLPPIGFSFICDMVYEGIFSLNFLFFPAYSSLPFLPCLLIPDPFWQPPSSPTDSPFVPCMCFTNSQKVAKQLIIHRGLHPIVIPDGHLWNTNKDVVLDHVKRLGFAGQGDRVVVLTGELQHEGSTSTSGTYYMDVK